MTLTTDQIPGAPPPDYYDHDDGTNTCFLCHNPDYSQLYEIKHFDFPFTFHQCQCGLIKQSPMPNEKFFDWFFNSDIFFSSRQKEKKQIWGYYDYFSDEGSRLSTSKYRYKKLSNFFSRPMQIMKIGPSTGTFLHVANQNGHNAIGCDVSTRFAEYARQNYGAVIQNGRFEKMSYKDGQFDAILLFNVIENIPNQKEFLESIKRTLKPGGYFTLNYVPMDKNFIASMQRDKYFLFRPPICYVYRKDVMARVLKKFGFSIVKTFRDVRYMHLEKIFTLLGWKWPLALARILRIHRLPFPIYAYPSRIMVCRRD